MTDASSMRCIQMQGEGGPEVLVLGSAPIPQPGPGQVLIRVQAAGVNRPDIVQRQGLYPPPPDASPLLGLEVAGTVAALGEGVSDWNIGDAVCALTPGGGYAEYCVTAAAHCLPWPKGYDAISAAALPETFFTVWANVFEMAGLQAGESLLVHGGSGGIGNTAIQLGKALGATVYATAGDADKCAVCEKLGATRAINYRSESFDSVIAELTHKRGVDVILDIVGGDYTMRNIRSLAMDGRLVQIAMQKGPKIADFDLRPLMQRRARITGSFLRPRSVADKSRIAASLRARVWPLLDAGQCAPIIHQVFDLADAAEAHRVMESGVHVGKLMLRV